VVKKAVVIKRANKAAVAVVKEVKGNGVNLGVNNPGFNIYHSGCTVSIYFIYTVYILISILKEHLINL